MRHLDFDRVIDLVDTSASAEEAAHLEVCEACRHRLALWRMRLEDLRAIEGNTVEEEEMHGLRVLFREFAPSPGARSWVARLVRMEDPAVAAAVRGSLAAAFAAYEAGPYRIVLQIRPSDTEGQFDVHGQLAGDASRTPESTQVVLTNAGGFVDCASVDRFGEFRIAGVPEGPCRLVWYGGGERIDLRVLEVGGGDGGNRN